MSTSVGADEVAAAVVASKVVSTRKAKKMLSRSEEVEQRTKKDPNPEQEVVASEQSNVRISPRTGKPMRVYKKRIK